MSAARWALILMAAAYGVLMAYGAYRAVVLGLAVPALMLAAGATMALAMAALAARPMR